MPGRRWAQVRRDPWQATATLAAGLAAGLDMPPAVRLANRAAGIVVGKFGTAVVHSQELFGSAAGQGV